MLNASRTGNGAGPNPLALSEILVAASHFGLDPENTLTIVQALDRVFLDEWNEKRKREAAAAKAK